MPPCCFSLFCLYKTFCTCRRVKCLILDLLSEECWGHLSCWQFSCLVSVTLMAQRSESSRWMKPLGNTSGSMQEIKSSHPISSWETMSYLTVATIESYPLPSHLISPSVLLKNQLPLAAVDIGSLDESSSFSFQLSVSFLFADCHWKWSPSWVNCLWLIESVCVYLLCTMYQWINMYRPMSSKECTCFIYKGFKYPAVM